ncbi:DUF2934 domain-containing protein [Rhizobium sp. RCC_161_2]|uniref:DUF2934 domain-containing protein n=1 Tax=Rhizobium sp. RCC_161_2 TaxID=3239219 RepID=UPI003525EF60
MLESRDEWIEKRAYAIWEAEGYPSGRDAVHWEQASQERIALEKSTGKGKKSAAKPKAKIDVKPKATPKVKVTAAAPASDVAAKAAPKRASKKAVEAKV